MIEFRCKVSMEQKSKFRKIDTLQIYTTCVFFLQSLTELWWKVSEIWRIQDANVKNQDNCHNFDNFRTNRKISWHCTLYNIFVPVKFDWIPMNSFGDMARIKSGTDRQTERDKKQTDKLKTIYPRYTGDKELNAI